MPLTRANSGPINNVPATVASPPQVNIVDICSVLVDVQTSMSGNDVVIVDIDSLQLQRFNLIYVLHVSI